MKIKNKFKYDKKLIKILFVFFIISLLSLYSADNINQTVDGIVYKQSLWFFIGTITIIIITKVKNNFIIRNIKLFYIICNILLVLLLFFGKSINNARCWFSIPGIGTIQPSEFMKVILIIFISTFIDDYFKKHPKRSIKEELILIFKIMCIVVVPSILTFLEPDTGAVIMYLILTITILFISKIRIRFFVIGIVILLIMISTTLILYYFNMNLFIKILGNSFFLRVERLINWTSLEGMQLENGMISIASSGLFGFGFNKSPMYIPEAHTDFIFAVYASNFGYLGCFILISIILYFDLYLIILIKKSKNKVNKYIISGILGLLLYQQVQNIGMTFGLLPITGITLPFISYGGSSLLSYMIMMGLIFNISNENNKYRN